MTFMWLAIAIALHGVALVLLVQGLRTRRFVLGQLAKIEERSSTDNHIPIPRSGADWRNLFHDRLKKLEMREKALEAKESSLDARIAELERQFNVKGG